MSYSVKKISELFSDIKIGGTPSRGNPAFFNGKNLWVSIKDMNGQSVITSTAEMLSDEGVAKSNCKLVVKGSLLFSFKLTVGKVAFAGCDLYTNEAIASFDPNEAKSSGIDLNYFSMVLPIAAKGDSTKNSMGASLLSKDRIYDLKIPIPKTIDEQKEIARQYKEQFFELEKAREAIEEQRKEVSNLANALIYESLSKGGNHDYCLGKILDEVKAGIGKNWQQYPVYGATRSGIALAKEPPGKHAPKYKPVVPGTVFYNPMRILIGSIAFAEDDVENGITSPDYVVLKGKEGVVDSRWFYFWLRSPLGVQCINSLARGAVRERMLFNRLAEGQIELPDYIFQKEASEVLQNLKQISGNLSEQLKEIEVLPNKILSNIFKEA